MACSAAFGSASFHAMRVARSAIYVVDAHPLMRDAIVMVLRHLRPEAHVVALDRLARLADSVGQHGRPRLVCLGLKLPGTTGCSGVSAVRRTYPEARVAVYSAVPAADMARACIEAGADRYIEKSTGAGDLAAALRGLLQGEGPAPAGLS